MMPPMMDWNAVKYDFSGVLSSILLFVSVYWLFKGAGK
jgi:hypothetical protein